jgi:plastocyanin
MRRLLAALTVATILLGGLAACGDDDDDGGTVASGETGSSDDAGGDEQTISVTAKGFAFDPTSATATAGEVYFEVENDDTTKHTFTIDDTDVDIQLDPGKSGEAEADLEAGTYEWHCTIHSSMTGTLTVS